ncbi:hypothetical protein FLAVO9R_120108 [Flavobacterium sp. 9R]|nr:hypothetical protein FLAVO9R_120108 [Flavobacterium sp. 9R]
MLVCFLNNYEKFHFKRVFTIIYLIIHFSFPLSIFLKSY